MIGTDIMTTLTESKEQYANILAQKQQEILNNISFMFGGDDAAMHIWLAMPSYGLDKQKPRDLLWCISGCDILLTYLKQIDRGVYV